MALIAAATGWEALGLVPFFADARLLPAEDALALDGARAPASRSAHVKIAVPMLPHIANFDDLDPLDAEPAVELVRVRPGSALPGDADLVILPGSKATIADLAALRAAGFDIDIAAHRAPRRHACSACAAAIRCSAARCTIPTASKGRRRPQPGLGLLDVETMLSAEKRLEPVRGDTRRRRAVRRLRDAHGRDQGPGLRAAVRPARRRRRRRRDVGRRPRDRHLYPRAVRRRSASAPPGSRASAPGPTTFAYDALVETTLDRLAAHLAAHIDLDRLLKLALMSATRTRNDRDQQRIGADDRASSAARISASAGLAPAVSPSRVLDQDAAIDARAARARDRARRPSRLPDSRRWASGDGGRRARTARQAACGRRVSAHARRRRRSAAPRAARPAD